MPTILTAVNCPINPVFSGVYAVTSPPLTSPTILQAETTNARPKVNEAHTRADLTARFGGGAFALVHGCALSAGAGLILNIATGQAQINGTVTIPSGVTVSLTDGGRNWIWLSQAGAITVVFVSLTPPAGAQCLLGSALTAAGVISSVDTSGVLELKGGMLKRTTADTTTPGDTPPAQLMFWHFGASAKVWYWNGLTYTELSTIATPISIANGGTGATTAAGARANLAVSREQQLIKTVNIGGVTLTGDETTYSQIELAQGTVAAGWVLTFPSAATMVAAGTVAGHEWVIRNDTNFAVRIVHPGTTDRLLPEQSQGQFFFDGAEVREVAQTYPHYLSLVAPAADYSFAIAAEQAQALIDIEVDGANRRLNFVADTQGQRGRLVAVRSNQDSSTILTAGTAAGDVEDETVFLPGELQLTVMLSDGSLVPAPSRPYTRRVAITHDDAASFTVLQGDTLAVLIEVGGTLTAARNLVLRTINHKLWFVRNATAGGFGITVKTAAGTGVRIPNGKGAWCYGDGTNIVRADTLASPTGGGSLEAQATQIATGTVANTVTETTLFSTLIGTATLDANLLKIGRMVRVTAWGVLGTTGTPTLRIRTKIGAVTNGDSGAVTMATVTGRLWKLELEIACRAVGATGTIQSQARFFYMPAATTVAANFWELGTGSNTLDTTAANALNITAEWSVADAANTISASNITIEILN